MQGYWFKVLHIGKVESNERSGKERHVYVAYHIKWYYAPENSTDLLDLYYFMDWDFWDVEMSPPRKEISLNDVRRKRV